jgi:ABC-type dipeptide/oligopeptide/nickel transport system permease subunit
MVLLNCLISTFLGLMARAMALNTYRIALKKMMKNTINPISSKICFWMVLMMIMEHFNSS